jgi:hypothetical protein
MTDPIDSREDGESTQEIDFDRAQFKGSDATDAMACANCGTPLASAYFTAGEAVVCEQCRYRLEAWLNDSGGWSRFARAGAFGVGAAAVGALLWYVVTEVTGYEIGLVAIAVGWLVGAAVRAGTKGRGGVTYQVMAVVLTYLAIVSTYVPQILASFSEPPAIVDAREEAGGAPAYTESDDSGLTAGTAVRVILFAMALPFLAGFDNLIGLLIIGFALWQAWSSNKSAAVPFEGPFQVGAPRPVVS